MAPKASSRAAASRTRSPPIVKRHMGRQQLRQSLAASSVEHGSASAPPHVAVGSHMFDSKTAFEKVRQWCWGLASAKDVKKDCANALEDQRALLAGLSLSQDLASQSLQAFGMMSEHHTKDRLIHLLGDCTTSEPHVEPIPMLIGKTGEIDTVPFPILLPHAEFANTYKHFKTRWSQQYLGKATVDVIREADIVLPEFWKEVVTRKDPRIQHHPLCTRPNWMTKACVFQIHGDAVPCISVGKPGSKSFDVYSSSGVLAQGSTIETKTYIFGLFDKCNVTEPTTHCTMTHIWKIVFWSLFWLWLGRWPTHDWHGIEYQRDSPEGKLAHEDIWLADGFFWCSRGSQE